jgi:Pentapeptide repeats (8 copies)
VARISGGARLENADLRRADLTDSNLNNAYFGTRTPGQPGFERGTDLRHATLTRTQLENTHDFSVALTEEVIGLADGQPALAGRQAWPASAVQLSGRGQAEDL